MRAAFSRWAAVGVAFVVIDCGGPAPSDAANDTPTDAVTDAVSNDANADAADVPSGPCGHPGTMCCAGGICRLAGLMCGSDNLCHSSVPLYASCNPAVDQCAMGTCLRATIMPPGATMPGTFCSVTCDSVASCPMDPGGAGVTCIGPADAGLDCYRACDLPSHTCPAGLTCAVYTDAHGVMSSFCVPNGM